MTVIHDIANLSPAAAERMLFADIVAKLTACLGESSLDLANDPVARVERHVRLSDALYQNARLWIAMLDDLMDGGNRLSPELKEMLVVIGRTAVRLGHSALRRTDQLPLLIAINGAIVKGLDGVRRNERALPAPRQWSEDLGSDPRTAVVVDLASIRSERDPKQVPTQLLTGVEERRDGIAGDAVRRHRILVVDDEEPVCKTLRTTLEMAGFEVATARHGGEGLARIDREPFDLAIVDIFMPEVDGLEVIRTIRSRGAAAIVAISGGSSIVRHRLGKEDVDFLDMARALGAAAALRKPFTAKQLLTTVNDTLGARCS